jgi:PAS domain S-box-containing protein
VIKAGRLTMNAIGFNNKPMSASNLASRHGRAEDGGEASEVVEANTRLMQENKRLKQERDLLRALIDNYPDSIYAKDKSSRRILANKTSVRNVGCKTEAEVLGKADLEFYAPEVAAKLLADDQKVLAGELLLDHEERLTTTKGEVFWMLATKVPWRDDNGNIMGIIGGGRNITKQKEIERRLTDERNLLRTMIDNLPDYIYVKDAQGRFVLANMAVARQMGFSSPEEIIGKSDFDLFPHELAARYRAEEEEMIRTGKGIFNHEGPTVDASKRGKNRWVSTTKVILRDPQGKVTGFIGLGRDITERRRMDEVLAQERSLLRTLINNLPDCIYAKDTAGRKILANPADLKNYHCQTEAEAIGKTDFDLFPKEIAEKFYADDQKVLHGEPVDNREEFFMNESGQKRWLLTSKLPLRDQSHKIIGLVGIGRDITAQKQAMEALEESEQRLREVVRSTRCILNCGEAEAPAGWQERVKKELTIFRWNFPVLNVEAAQEVLPLDVPPGKTYQQVWSESRHPDDFNQMHKVTRDAFLSNAPFYRNEFRCTDKHGVEHWMQEFITVHKLTENRWQLFGINTDITELKKTESALRSSEAKLRQFTTQLERSNRELQDFAYVASHDLQEPLRKIVVFGERLKEQGGDELDGQSRDYLDRMQKAAARMQTLINDLLTFSRVTTRARPFTQVDLAQVAREVVTDLEGRIELVKGRVEVGTLPLIDAEVLQMRQLFQNLIGNALKFRRLDVPPVVKVAAEIITSRAPDEGTTVVRKFCRLTVSDNGIGFDEKYLDRIFNVFQRLHSRNDYEGTGMGLAIARKIVLFHRGEITAKSKPGEGTTFIVTLPVTHPREQQTAGENHE